MNQIQRPVNNHDLYHAHLYFDEHTVDIATEIYKQIHSQFSFEIGRFHEKCVGPHTKWMFQVSFTNNDFASFINWLNDNRSDFSILIHPVTGNDLQDHTEYASWLGDNINLNLKLFEKQKLKFKI